MRKFWLLLLIPFCMSCIWDRDTLAEDGKGRMDAAKTIVGWFDRNPSRYYEMRLERVLDELKEHPNKLELYDDAAVAMDRLHRSDQAIEMMRRKQVALTKLTDAADEKLLWEHQYRYLANLGTFYAHRWIGKDREVRNADLSDLKKAEVLIAEAIEHNPNAHFGREEYQLQTLQWLQTNQEEASLVESPAFMLMMSARTKNKDLDSDFFQEVSGWSGMIRLGAAWRSVDIFHALSISLNREGRNALGYAAFLRMKELQKNEQRSLHPKLSEPVEPPHPNFFLKAPINTNVENWFQSARDAADQRHLKRVAYMNKRFDQNRHPDTDPNFWSDWKEPESPKFPATPLFDRSELRNLILWTIICLVFPESAR